MYMYIYIYLCLIIYSFIFNPNVGFMWPPKVCRRQHALCEVQGHAYATWHLRHVRVPSPGLAYAELR